LIDYATLYYIILRRLLPVIDTFCSPPSPLLLLLTPVVATPVLPLLFVMLATLPRYHDYSIRHVADCRSIDGHFRRLIRHAFIPPYVDVLSIRAYDAFVAC